MKQSDTLIVPYADEAITADDFGHTAWTRACVAPLENYWSGQPAPLHRRAEARLMWTPDALLVRYVCAQDEPLRMRQEIDLTQKTHGLWDFDVCEIFVAPDKPERYFEFEAAPTGEWLDVEIDWRGAQRNSNWGYQSGMKTAARIENKQVTLGMWIPWTAFGRKPESGERWRANLFRCVGPLDDTRGYLAWRPTNTPTPNFHVPQAFGWLEFKGIQQSLIRQRVL